MKTSEIREKFLNYFKNLEHKIVESSPVVPISDPTLLFTNAGMNQFKDLLLGTEKRDYVRAASSQKCIRAGGKHNDLENVGFTARHLTFFEMLGNWSFGDYYKKEAIEWAWNFLINEMKLPKDKLFVSIYKDDDEAHDIWKNHIGLPEEKIVRLGDIENDDEENFWSMGPTGPCGPCTEIHFDTGEKCRLNNPDCGVGCDCDRYLEIWNNVFMQYNRDENGTLHPLKMKSVDTGLGLERLAAVMQSKNNNFDIDIFEPIKNGIEKISGKKYIENLGPFRVILDHIRCLTFAIADGALPSNEGRGYVLRRILRRALRFGTKIGINEPFLYKLVNNVVVSLGEVYPEIKNKENHIKQIVLSEEERFLQTLERGIDIFNKKTDELLKNNKTVISGKDVFILYDTYGFPVDLTALMAKEKNMEVDLDGFEREMEIQRQSSKKTSKFETDYDVENIKFSVIKNEVSEFVGYDNLETETEIISFRKSKDIFEVVLEKTPFYAESGGQVGDTGVIKNSDFIFKVLDTQKRNNNNVCICKLEKGIFKSEELKTVIAAVDKEKRIKIQKNHSATHLLQKALQQILGDHIEQSGSYVSEKQLRFDFSHFKKVDSDELKKIENQVNEVIQQNIKADITFKNIDEAKAMGAMALFGEKYGDIVRVVKFGDYSIELCGGAHINCTGNIGLFKIINETAVAAGIRRIEAVTGNDAIKINEKNEELLENIIGILGVDKNAVLNKVIKIMEEHKSLQKEFEELKMKSVISSAQEMFEKIEIINDIPFLYLRLENCDIEQVKMIVDEFRKKQSKGIIVIGNIVNEKVILVAGVTKNLIAQYKAGEIVKKIAKEIGGGGGGSPLFAQAGGKHPEKLDQAVEDFKKEI